MDRRRFLKGLAIPLLSSGCASAGSPHRGRPAGTVRVRPGDVAWPSDARWDELRRAVGGRLIAPPYPSRGVSVTSHGGRYVQGGGCATVGVAGLIQSGGWALKGGGGGSSGVVTCWTPYQYPDRFRAS
jgi:hypothetical protein